MSRVLRCDLVLLKASSTYCKKTKARWELEEDPGREDGELYYEDIPIGSNIFKSFLNR